MKSVLQSKTVWLAVLQAVLGVAIVIATETGEAGVALILKSIVDIALRYATVEPLK